MVFSSELSRDSVRRATVILIALRVGYAYNWFDIGPGFVTLGEEFHVGPADWGLLTAGFLVGAGLLQVPAGFLSRRYGPRAVSLWGVGLLAVAGVASAVSPSFGVLLATRVAAGVGAALFFSPAIGLVGSLYPPGRRGLAIGTFSSAFSAGAGLGVLGSSLLIPEVGWRGAMAIGGITLGVLVLLALILVPRRAGAPTARRPAPSRGLPAGLRYRGAWAIGFAFVGLEGATFATGQFIVPYGESVEGWSIALAGVVGMLFVFPSFFGGPVGGPIAERHRNHRTQLVLATVLSGGVLAALPLVGLAGAVIIGCVFSLSYGFIYAVMYVLPQFWREVPPEEVPLTIGLFNSIQLAGGAIVSFLFGYVVAATSYPVAWSVLALTVGATLVALVALPPTPATSDGPPDAGGRAPS
ncbi:MAG TPA: MFS transporter [Thermoplasmata archaeon]|nr:MFS transporter [Thermoplasmata archaeon]